MYSSFDYHGTNNIHSPVLKGNIEKNMPVSSHIAPYDQNASCYLFWKNGLLWRNKLVISAIIE